MRSELEVGLPRVKSVDRLGFTLLFLPSLADKYGRRYIYTVCMWLMLPVMITMMLTHSINVMIVCIICQGMISTARVSIGFVYMMEFIPKENHAFLCTFFMIQAPFITLLATIYFAFISKHWFWFCSIGVLMLICVDICSYWLPESPKYLLKAGKTSEAKTILTRIAKANGVPLLTF